MKEKLTRRSVMAAAALVGVGTVETPGTEGRGSSPTLDPPDSPKTCRNNSCAFHFPETAEEALRLVELSPNHSGDQYADSDIQVPMGIVLYQSPIVYYNHHLFVIVARKAAQMIRDGAQGYMYILTSPEICCILEADHKTAPVPCPPQVGLQENEFLGWVNQKWGLVRASKLPKNMLILGVGKSEQTSFDPADYSMIRLSDNAFR